MEDNKFNRNITLMLVCFIFGWLDSHMRLFTWLGSLNACPECAFYLRTSTDNKHRHTTNTCDGWREFENIASIQCTALELLASKVRAFELHVVYSHHQKSAVCFSFKIFTFDWCRTIESIAIFCCAIPRINRVFLFLVFCDSNVVNFIDFDQSTQNMRIFLIRNVMDSIFNI